MSQRTYRFALCVLVAIVGLALLDRVVTIREKQAIDAKADRVLTLLEDLLK